MTPAEALSSAKEHGSWEHIFKLNSELQHFKAQLESLPAFATHFTTAITDVPVKHKDGYNLPKHYRLILLYIKPVLRTIEVGDCPCWKNGLIDQRCAALGRCPFATQAPIEPKKKWRFP
jgi:hypothetical protein